MGDRAHARRHHGGVPQAARLRRDGQHPGRRALRATISWARSSPPAQPPAISVKLVGTAPFAKVQIVKDNQYVYTVEPNEARRQLHVEGQRRGEGQDQLLLRARRAAGRRTGVGQPDVDHVPVSRKAAIILNTMPQTLSRRQMLRAAGAAPLLAAWNQASAAGRRPNIVVILADDQGWGDLSVNGNTNLSTPNIDSLARDGALFERFFVCPVCSPTRAEFLTGRYHPRGGVHGVSTGGERLNLDEKTIADTFKAAGYATGAFGKWHNGTQYPYHPNARGFDEYYGFTSGHWGQYFDPPLEHNGTDASRARASSPTT